MEFTFTIGDSLPGFHRAQIDYACTMENDHLQITAWGDTPIQAFTAACRWYCGHHMKTGKRK